MQEILEYLKKSGERMDAEIAAATGHSLSTVRANLAKLSAQGHVVACQATRFNEGKPVKGILCRVAGFTPPAAPGRKTQPKQ